MFDLLFDFIKFILGFGSVARAYERVNYLIKFTQADMTIVEQLYDYFAPWAYYMLLIYFLMAIVDAMTREQVTVEILGRMFLKLVAGMVFIQYGKIIISTALSLGNTAITWCEANVMNLGDATNITTDLSQEMFDDLGFGGCVIMLIPSVLMWVIGVVISFVMKFQLYARKFEMCIRLSFAPIAFGDACGGGSVAQSNALRYAKKILALSLQGAAIVAVFAIGVAFQKNAVAASPATEEGAIYQVMNAFVTMLDQFVIILCVLGAITTSKQVLNDALGVH